VARPIVDTAGSETWPSVARMALVATLALIGCGGEPSCGGGDAGRPSGDATPPQDWAQDGEAPEDADLDVDTPADADAPGDASDGGASPRSITVAVISDLNGAYGSTEYGSSVHAAVDRIVALSHDLVLSTGDMVAGQQAGLDYTSMWTGFHEAVTNRLLAAHIPLAVTPGNHDGSGYDAYAAERSVYVTEWSARRPAVTMVDDAHYPVRYAFSVGPALFVAVDASTVGALGDEQMRWLDERLASSAEDYAATVVFGHLPLHPVAVGRETESIGDPALERLLTERGVDLYVAGHHHAYYPGRRGALRLVSVGCLGSGARPLLGMTEPAPKSFVVLEVGAEGVTRVDARVGDRFEGVLDRSTLPGSLGDGAAQVRRDDL